MPVWIDLRASPIPKLALAELISRELGNPGKKLALEDSLPDVASSVIGCPFRTVAESGGRFACAYAVMLRAVSSNE